MSAVDSPSVDAAELSAAAAAELSAAAAAELADEEEDAALPAAPRCATALDAPESAPGAVPPRPQGGGALAWCAASGCEKCGRSRCLKESGTSCTSFSASAPGAAAAPARSFIAQLCAALRDKPSADPAFRTDVHHSGGSRKPENHALCTCRY